MRFSFFCPGVSWGTRKRAEPLPSEPQRFVGGDRLGEPTKQSGGERRARLGLQVVKRSSARETPGRKSREPRLKRDIYWRTPAGWRRSLKTATSPEKLRGHGGSPRGFFRSRPRNGDVILLHPDKPGTHSGERSIHLLYIELFGIERAAQPFPRCGVLWVAGITDSLQ